MKGKKQLTALVLAGLCASTLTAQAADLPGYFDWRRVMVTDRTSAVTNSIVPAVRDQYSYGTCWTFGALGSYESNWNLQLRREGIAAADATAPVFSERYMAWLAFASTINQDPASAIHMNPQPIASNTGDQLVYEQGGDAWRAVSVIVYYGVALESEYPYVKSYQDTSMKGIDNLVTPSGLLHDAYGLKVSKPAGAEEKKTSSYWINNDIAYYKKLIQDYGILSVGFNVNAQVGYGFLNLESRDSNHSVCLVGWDDDYVINGIRGAWIMRNSWGGFNGENGYYYISYQDTSLQRGATLVPDLDSARYTKVSTWSPIGITGDPQPTLIEKSGTLAFANRLQASGSQLVKAVGFYVPNDAMSYTVSVRLRGTSPTDGAEVYTQSGTFGEGGLAMYRGYRTLRIPGMAA